MLTNLENQLREQNATSRLDEVLEEIPRVREDLGFIPLVTPTSQIVGTQAVLNVLTGSRYKSITQETKGVLRGEYGATPAPVNLELQARVLDGAQPISCRPADLLEDEFELQRAELLRISSEEGFSLANEVDDTLTYALFPQVGLKFLKNRNNPAAFEPAPEQEVAGRVSAAAAAPAATKSPAAMLALSAPLSGRVIRVDVSIGDRVVEGDVIVILEAMKMETEIRATTAGRVTEVAVKAGGGVQVGDRLVTIDQR